MLTNAKLNAKLNQLKESNQAIAWAVIDPSCHLSVRFDSKSGTSRFYFRSRSPQICRFLGLVDEITFTEARQKAFTL